MYYLDTVLTFQVTPDRLYTIAVAALRYLNTYRINYASENLRIIKATRIDKGKYDNMLEFQVNSVPNKYGSTLHLIIHDPDVAAAKNCATYESDGTVNSNLILEYVTLGRFRYILGPLCYPKEHVPKRYDDRLIQIAEEECAAAGIRFQRLQSMQKKFITHYRCYFCKLVPVHELQFSSNRARCLKCGNPIQLSNRGHYGRLRKRIAVRMVNEIRPSDPNFA